MTSTSGGDDWQPDQYGRFADERSRPFFDLLALVEPVPGGQVIDLGCGTGELTARLHATLGAAATVGLDTSAAMLARARPGDGLRFERGDIAEFADRHRYDVVFSNAALHWVGEHRRLFARLVTALRPGGQLAVQMPANFDHPSHALADEVAAEPRFARLLGSVAPSPASALLAPEGYAELLDDLGLVRQHVRLQVYGHHLSSTAEVVEWTKGSTLLRFERALSADDFAAFVEAYRRRLLETLGDGAPYLYTFKRLLVWGRLADR